MIRRGPALLSLLLLGASSAWAGGMHAGLPVSGVQGLGEPSFVSPSAGWTAPILQAGRRVGMVRVFVAPTEAAAVAWYSSALQREVVFTPPAAADLPVGLDAAHGDGVGLWLLRDGNFAALIQTDTGARELGETLRAALIDRAAPTPAPAVVEVTPGHGRVEGADVVHVQFEGGKLLPTRTGWEFSVLPTGMVIWDSLGRPTTWGAWQD